MDTLITEKIKGNTLTFKTRSGVFSKSGVDHGSKLLLDNVDLSVLPGRGLIADLGCGSGVIGLSLAKLLTFTHVHLLDVNLRCVELAKENVELNKLRNAEVFLSDQFSAVGTRSYHLIVSNPAQHLGNEFLEETANLCLQHLKPDGVVYWVVQKHLKPYVERLFNQVFGSFTVAAQGREHLVIKSTSNKKPK